MTPHALAATSITVAFGDRTVLDAVTLVVGAGALVVVTGGSGSGKTVLASVLAGLTAPDRGQVSVHGDPLGPHPDPAIRPSLVPQDFGLVSTLTAAETVALPLQVRALPRPEIRERVAQWLATLGLGACATRVVDELSGGQRQRVAIARCLASRAPVLVMDEPTAELDPINRDLVLSVLETERSHGTALCVISHDPAVISRADSVFELRAPDSPDERRSG